jgi:hypothetical protein
MLGLGKALSTVMKFVKQQSRLELGLCLNRGF